MAISKIITSSLTDDAVTSAKIGTDQVGADALSSSAISGAVDIPANSVGQSELSIDLSAQSVPHIIPGVLYPSYVASGTSNKLLDGTTNHSGAFGTEQSDGRKYYYTNIAGSKPIKDPRIGAHFGSQRHKFKSLQQLEQETATHGKNVYSVDGREWVRVVGNELSASYGGSGHFIMGNNVTAGSFMEVVGYFLDANFLNEQHTADRNLTVQVNGSSAVAFNDYNATVGSPLGGRYVDEAVLINIDLPTKNSASLGINTLRINFVTGSYPRPAGIELIAQDTTSTARRSEIKIPKQNVVSFGKKFEVGSDDLDNAVHPHYDPFNGFTSGNLAAVQALGIDTATSLGLSKWLPSDAATTYYRPFNGGRVIKWVDSSGTIKTSVNMMPPNAKSIANSASPTNAFATRTTASHFGTNNAMNSFEAGTDLDSDQLSEVAKTFHFREFGNGSANGGTGSANYADASMLNTADNIAYVMDDGLTSLAGDNVKMGGQVKDMLGGATNDGVYITFIGTGLTLKNTETSAATDHLVQNLPYGTHVVKYLRGGDPYNPILAVDGVTITCATANFAEIHELTFHQPKKPPIPEDCVVLCDYMLMADFVEIANAGIEYISKGVRFCSTSRDTFFDTGGGSTWSGTALEPAGGLGGMYQSNSGTDNDQNYFINEFFGSNAVVRMYDTPARVTTTQVRTGSGSFTSVTPTKSGSGYGAFAKGLTPTSLGNNATKIFGASGQWFTPNAMEFAPPIHTSSHYQSFETPFLHELVGGDRNMEQHNLVVSPDGKTWDEVTRDTSYIGNQCISTASPTDAQVQDKHPRLHTRWRGTEAKSSNWRVKTWLNKDFAIANDRVICLKDGNYRFQYTFRVTSSVGAAGTFGIILNDATTADASVTGHIFKGYHSDANQVMTLTGNYYLKRGDVISWQGPASDITQDTVQIERVK